MALKFSIRVESLDMFRYSVSAVLTPPQVLAVRAALAAVAAKSGKPFIEPYLRKEGTHTRLSAVLSLDEATASLAALRQAPDLAALHQVDADKHEAALQELQRVKAALGWS